MAMLHRLCSSCPPRIHLPGAALLIALLAACEAPLNLELVEEEGNRELRRYDMFQAVAHSDARVAVASSLGAIIVSEDFGNAWKRNELAGRPALIDITACGSGDFYALDTERRVWREDVPGEWVSFAVDTSESTLSIHCAPNGRLWVSASFSTLLWAEDDFKQWNEFSLYEDLQFTTVLFVDESNGYAVGEFGTIVASSDGGDTWELREPIPNEFYPMAADFLDKNTGWVGGLDGVIWQTIDGAQSWKRQSSVTSAPIYNLHASKYGVFAVGGSAKLVELRQDEWRGFEGAPEVLAFLRGLDTLSNGSLLVAGGSGTVAKIPLTDR